MAFTTTTGSGGTSLIGTSGVDTVSLNPGTISGAVYIGAQGDADVVSLQTSTANSYTVNMGSGNDTFVAAGATSSRITGDDGNDTITVTAALVTSTVSGFNGIDTININAGMNGGLVNGNNESDTINFVGALTNGALVVGGQGGDTINVTSATLTSGRVNGQDGADTITIGAGLVANMQIGGASINGGQGSDNMIATNAGNSVVMSGDLGNDTMLGGTGRDTLFGGDGDDSILGAAGGDSLIGGSGSDYFNAGLNNTSTFSGAAATTALAAGQTFTFGLVGAGSGPDVIVGASMGNGGSRIEVASAGAAPTAAVTAAGLAQNGLNGTTLYYLSGNYSASTGTFTVTGNGVGGDTMIIDGANNAAVSANTATIVLLGVNSSTLTAANFV